MKVSRIILLMGLGLTVSACASVDIPTRNAPFENLPAAAVAVPAGFELIQSDEFPIASAAIVEAAKPKAPVLSVGRSPVSVNTVMIRVPRSLKVSDANRYFPKGDIVWRGDPYGDRHLQVQRIFETALVRGVTGLDGPVAVDVDVRVLRFHALTEKARYTVGGVHAITFELALKNPETGELITPIRTIEADLEGYGGSQALAAEAQGQTQKVRITAHLAEVIRQELTNPEGYKNASLGFFQMLNGL